jgi:glucose-6-phosphate 1-dehydrogenase
MSSVVRMARNTAPCSRLTSVIVIPVRSCRTWYSRRTAGRTCDRYDRLIGAALDGNRVLFARQDTVEAAWRVVDPVLGDVVPVHPYQRGTWGPKEADSLLSDGDDWHDPTD